MNRFPGARLALAIAASMVAHAASATQICGWLTETVDPAGIHSFAFWLQADGDIQIFYAMKGEGVVSDCCRNYAPSSGTYVLHADQPANPWSFGATVPAPGDIDIVGEVHETPKSIFDDAESPLLASFAFKRHVGGDETVVPTGFAERRCVAVPPPAGP